MRATSGLIAAATLVRSIAVATTIPSSTINLDKWPKDAADQLKRMITKNANQSNYAVFDMDNTSYQNDLTETLLPFLEHRGILTQDNLDPSLMLIPFRNSNSTRESLFSYYYRLCAIDDMICYPWMAQAYAGFALRQLKVYIDELMSYNSTIPVTYYADDDDKKIVHDTVSPPKIFAAQVQLYNTLMAHNISVYVVTAAQEELVRMVVSDPKYGYNLPPSHVIGVSTILRNKTSNSITTSRLQISKGTYNETANLDLILGTYLWTPATWFSGKWAAILTYIDQWKRPVLVAGDTPKSDGYMLLHGVDTGKGGVHLFVKRSEKKWKEMSGLIEDARKGQVANGREVTADKNWVVVLPEQIL